MSVEPVLIIGGGIAGLACAEEISRRGGNIVLFERRRPGGEASWAAGGMLALDFEFETRSALGDLAARSRTLWDSWADRVGAEALAFGAHVRPRPEGTLVPARDAAALAALRARFAPAIAAGRPIDVLDAGAARAKEPALAASIAGAIHLRDDGPVNNRAVLLALIAALRVRKVEVVREANASIWIEGGRVRGVFANGRQYPGSKVVLAAGAWASAVSKEVALPSIFPVRGQMLGFHLPGPGGEPRPARSARSESETLHHTVRWEGGYAIPRGGGWIVAGSTSEPGAGFRKQVTPEGIATITSGFHAALPGFGKPVHTHAWSGLRPGTADELPVLGAHPAHPDLLLAIGLFRNGILLAPATAVAIADLVEGKAPSVPIEAFGAGRASLAGAESILVNGAARAFRPGTTVGGLLDELTLRRPGVAVAVNDEVVRRSEWDTTHLSDRDRVEIIHAVGGG